ncbi:histidinol-phosphatase [Halalkalibacter akibai]|uniref:Histidinol-phosphatase n=1 Tax=Halalkalibacter akibai (strain ATCC 43226 / DSM 21942 / CIP 109018 / JCM 9157 / 1139) TaxID=1236973 RepID=W4R0I0_HALA3|nr:histidinol-phosphatase [Halalkalibacter akibai]GAE37403.1 histidinol-phosphatase [Halalkalibacter akibai JCM 9157]
MKFDLHTHNEMCGHALGTIEDYIKAGIANDLQVIGISDHTPYFHSEEDHPYPGITMPRKDFAFYVEEVLRLKKKYEDQIKVLLGIESDFFPTHSGVYQENLLKHPFDYVIGSVHFVDDVSIFKKSRWDGLTQTEKVKTKETYFNLIEQSAKSGMFQILGHIDAMKGFYPEFSAIEIDTLDQTLQVIGESNVAIEINTSGKTKDCGGWYPSDEILERALFHKVAVTFGSDAHKPERVGDEFEEVRLKLKEIGFKEWCYYSGKQRQIVQI